MSDELTVLAKTLQHLHSSGKLVVSKAAEVTGIDESSFYRWLSGDAEPLHRNISLLIMHYPCKQVRDALIRATIGGLPVVWTELPEDLDINGDGTINIDDALKANIKAMQSLVEQAAKIGDDAVHGTLSDTAFAEYEQRSQEAIAAILTHIAILNHIQMVVGRKRGAHRIAVPLRNGRAAT